MYLTKTKQGHYIPSSDTDSELSKKLSVGTEVKAKAARNVKFHRKAFALLNLGFENQTLSDNFESYRRLKTVEAGFFDRILDKFGDVHTFPLSLSFDEMSAEKFERWYVATIEVIAADMCQQTETVRNEIDKFY